MLTYALQRRSAGSSAGEAAAKESARLEAQEQAEEAASADRARLAAVMRYADVCACIRTYPHVSRLVAVVRLVLTYADVCR
jgi:hypothetical protein